MAPSWSADEVKLVLTLDVATGGLLMDDVWNEKRVITIDLLGDEFLEAVETGDPVTIHEDGTVEIG